MLFEGGAIVFLDGVRMYAIVSDQFKELCDDLSQSRVKKILNIQELVDLGLIFGFPAGF